MLCDSVNLTFQNTGQECSGSFFLRIVKDILGISLFNNIAVCHKNDPVADISCKTHFMGYNDLLHAFFCKTR